jgi:hypothetical protein
MTEFESWRSYWDFERATKRQTRYVRDADTEGFLATVLSTAEKRVESIPSERFLWRAQLGCAWEPLHQDGQYIDDVPAPFPPERMRPLPDRAVEGRANPKGIAYLYVATNRETALAEVRPWIGSLVSVGQFKTLRPLRVVNCTSDNKGSGVRAYFREPPADEREECVWLDIDQAFARPVTRSDDVADYAPTQILAELFKANGFDGVAYRSALGPGHNVAVFDLGAAEIANCFVWEVKSVSFEFAEAANPYFLRAKDGGQT